MNRTILIKLGVKYTIVYAGLTVFGIYLGSGVFDYAFGLAAVVLLVGSLIIAPLLVGRSDTAIETAEASAEAGFQDVTNPSQYRVSNFSFPGKIEVTLYLIGLACFCVIGLLLLS